MKKLLLATGATIIITTLCAMAAYKLRGYFAIGGEALIWTIPILYYILSKELKEVKKIAENEQ